jgi:hypothetical protein
MRRRLVSIVLICCALGVGVAATLAATATDSSSGREGRLQAISSPDTRPSAKDKGVVKVVYRTPARADRPIAKLIESSGVGAKVAASMNRNFALKRDITIVFGGNKNGPFYDSVNSTVQYPWAFVRTTQELLDANDYRGADLNDGVVDATRFIVDHELGHALIHQFTIPVLGSEEDAADSFATFLATALEDDGNVVIAATDLFAAFFEQTKEAVASGAAAAGATSEFSDPHSSDLQRFYTISCLVYGSDTKRYANVVAGLGIDKNRLASCPATSRKAADSWHQVLDAHIKR